MSAAQFTITASPGTDVWRKPPSTDVFNAPRQQAPTATSSGSLATFHSARLSFLLPPVSALTQQYDQAGLLLSLTPRQQHAPPAPPPPAAAAAASPSPPKWIKTGVEVYNGQPRAATVACDSWADWSLSPVSEDEEAGGWVTVEVVRGGNELGKSSWVHQVVVGGGGGGGGSGGDGTRVPLREVCWPFGLEGGADAWDVRVEAYACRPSKTASGELKAEFKQFDVKWV